MQDEHRERLPAPVVFLKDLSVSTRDKLSEFYLSQMSRSMDLLATYKETKIFEEEWEVLIILDACRPDSLASVAPDFTFLPKEINTIYSSGSSSRTWMEANFTTQFAEEMAETIYVTGNPFSESQLREKDFHTLDEVWRFAWDEEAQGMPARPITDTAIKRGRTTDCSRMIVHYMQPHFPSFPDPLDSGTPLDTWGNEWESVWDRLYSGNIDIERVKNSYTKNLKYVLEDVNILVENIDAEPAVITADHANAFGELGVYGHPPEYNIPVLRRVPWVTLSTTDQHNHSPDLKLDEIDRCNNESNSITHVEKLQSLGYLAE